MSVASLWLSGQSASHHGRLVGFQEWRIYGSHRHFDPLTRPHHSNSHTAVGQNDAVHLPPPIIEMRALCASQLTPWVDINRPTTRQSRALAQRRVVTNVAYVPRPDWREAEISMPKRPAVEDGSTSCSFLSTSH